MTRALSHAQCYQRYGCESRSRLNRLYWRIEAKCDLLLSRRLMQEANDRRRPHPQTSSRRTRRTSPIRRNRPVGNAALQVPSPSCCRCPVSQTRSGHVGFTVDAVDAAVVWWGGVLLALPSPRSATQSSSSSSSAMRCQPLPRALIASILSHSAGN
jgi:hypothetical protein